MNREQLKQQQIFDAKQVLKSHGYYADVLWHIDDIQHTFQCYDDLAQVILYDVLESPELTEHIFALIKAECIKRNLPKSRSAA